MKKVMFVGQAMPRMKRNPHDWPSLNAWLATIWISREQIEENFLYSALVDYFPGSLNGAHIVPSREDIEKELPRLHKMIKEFNPDIMVPIGKLSISYCLGEKVDNLKDVVGNSYLIDPYLACGKNILTIPLPHPSGASTWRHKVENKALLIKAFNLLQENCK